MITLIGDIDLAGTVDCNTAGRVKPRGSTGTIHSTGHARRAGQRGDDTGCSDLANHMVLLIGDINAAITIDRCTERHGKPRVGAGTIHAAGHARCARKRRHDTRSREPADRVVGSVSHINIACSVHRHAGRVSESCRSARAIHATRNAGCTGQRSHHSCAGDLADRVVLGIPHVHVAHAVECDTQRMVETGCDACTIRTPRQCRGTGKRGDDLGIGHLADAMAISIGHIDIVRVIYCHTRRQIETRSIADTVCASRHTCRAGDRCHDSDAIDLADRVITTIAHIDVPGSADRHARGQQETRAAPLPILTSRCTSHTSKRCHHTGRSNLANSTIRSIGYINITKIIDCNASQMVKVRPGSCAVHGAGTRNANEWSYLARTGQF